MWHTFLFRFARHKRRHQFDVKLFINRNPSTCQPTYVRTVQRWNAKQNRHDIIYQSTFLCKIYVDGSCRSILPNFILSNFPQGSMYIPSDWSSHQTSQKVVNNLKYCICQSLCIFCSFDLIHKPFSVCHILIPYPIEPI